MADIRWQYKLISSRISEADSVANHLGVEGWEMINSWEEPSTTGYPHALMVFKRDLSFDRREEARRQYALLLIGLAKQARDMINYPTAPGPKERIRENLAEMDQIEAALGDPIAMIFKSLDVPGGVG